LKEKIQKLFTNVWNIPNVLTMLRLILVPVFALLFIQGHRKAALVVFIVASLTDLLDGFLARKLNQITDFGKLFDPLADKLMVVTAMVCQAIAGVFPWAAIIVVGAKELVMLLGGLFMLSKNVVVYSNYFGKTAQVFFIASLLLSFFHPSLAAGSFRIFGLTPDLLLLWITVGLAFLALAVYAAGAVKTLKSKKQ
jgi:CDP-diacylglycerol--glycerol-3-phosphate 3-phosphatidyltransferase